MRRDADQVKYRTDTQLFKQPIVQSFDFTIAQTVPEFIASVLILCTSRNADRDHGHNPSDSEV